jgi:hypothetical protein
MQRVRPAKTLKRLAVPAIVTICAFLVTKSVDAQTTTPPAPPAPADTATTTATPAAPVAWMDTLKFSAQIQAGIVGNPSDSTQGLNYGQLFTDRANSVLLNQLLLTATRPLDPKATDYDFGFKLQGMYGTDARYTHFFGVFDRVTTQRTQFDLVEANIVIHTPWLTDGGIDFKIGAFSTPLGYETIDPSTNPFYTHSYIFNFGLPFKQTGAYAVTHLTPNVDVYTGIDTGEQATFGPYTGDNNSAIAGMAGLGLTFFDGNLTILGLSHFGPENPSRTVPDADGYGRYENDAVIGWKATPALTFTSELNWIRDDKFKADAYGAAQYVSYALNDQFTLNARGEIYRDQNNFFVAAYPNSLAPLNAQMGFPATLITAAKATTYSEITLGFTYKPTVPAPISNLMIRPEVRYDSSLNGTKPFNNGQSTGAFLISADVILGF